MQLCKCVDILLIYNENILKLNQILHVCRYNFYKLFIQITDIAKFEETEYLSMALSTI